MNLFQALKEEQSIFRHFSHYIKKNNHTCFWSPEINTVPHWNLVYPDEQGLEIDLDCIKKLYFENSLTPHIIRFTQPKRVESISEEIEYFFLDKMKLNVNKVVHHDISHLDGDLDHFCEIIKKAFDFDIKTSQFFYQKMNCLYEQPNSKFYTINKKGSVIGCSSTFRTENGYDFMFNIATLPEFQRRGVAKSIIQYVTQVSERSLLIYSHNPIMREVILPKLGYKSLGSVWIEKIE